MDKNHYYTERELIGAGATRTHGGTCEKCDFSRIRHRLCSRIPCAVSEWKVPDIYKENPRGFLEAIADMATVHG